MNVDDTIRRITKEVKLYLEEKYGVILSEEEILDIADSQFRGAVYGLKKGVSIKLPVIGRFLYVDKSTTKQKVTELSKVRDLYSEIEFEQKVLEGKIATIKRNKKRWEQERANPISVVELVKKPNISNGRIMYDKLSKIVQQQENGE